MCHGPSVPHPCISELRSAFGDAEAKLPKSGQYGETGATPVRLPIHEAVAEFMRSDDFDAVMSLSASFRSTV